jgi:predicted MPP superfamily phosphohydrolase
VGLFLFSALIHAYVGLRLVPALDAWPWAMVLLGLLLVASAVLMPMGLFARRVQSRRLAHVLAWAGVLFMGLFSSLFMLTLLRDVVLAATHLVYSAGWFKILGSELADLGVFSAAAVPLVALGITTLGWYNARRTAAVVNVDVPIANLPEALHGFTIAQISDVHVGPTIKRPYVSAIVESVNRLNADMVAVTGDLVDGTVAELAQHVAPLAQLRSRHGTYFVTGNHEYYSGVHAWLRELKRLDVHVLMNEHVVLEHGSAQLLVAGVSDPSAHHFDPSHRSDPARALVGAPASASVRLLLAHQPRSAAAAARAGFHLQLSGHTHGGQFFPWNLLIKWFQPFAAGLHKLQNLWVYTSRGTGYWGPPKRLGAPSEISFLRLVPQQG